MQKTNSKSSEQMFSNVERMRDKSQTTMKSKGATELESDGNRSKWLTHQAETSNK